jgi:hypothetical protein
VQEEIKILGNLVNSKSSKPGIFFKTLLWIIVFAQPESCNALTRNFLNIFQWID